LLDKEFAVLVFGFRVIGCLDVVEKSGVYLW
jgi:hypothetical protein